MRKFLVCCLSCFLLLAHLPASAADSFDPFGTYAWDQCSFSEPSEGKASAPTREMSEEKRWAEAEKATFRQDLAAVEKTHAMLLALATRNHHVTWRRTAGDADQDIRAETVHSAIYFMDSYFKLPRWDRVVVILHELAHVVDEDSRYSLSKEWCQIVSPRIAKFKQHYPSLSFENLSYSEANRADIAAQKCGLPRAYAAEGPGEAFACFVESLSLNMKDPQIERFFSRTVPLLDVCAYDQFENRLDERDRVEDLLCEARNYVSQGRDQEAMKCYSLILAEESDLPSVYSSIGGLWTKKGDYELARNAFQKEVSLLDQLLVPKSCKEYACAAINLCVSRLRGLQSQGYFVNNFTKRRLTISVFGERWYHFRIKAAGRSSRAERAPSSRKTLFL